MLQVMNPPILHTIRVLIAICLIAFPAQTEYSGGSGMGKAAVEMQTAGTFLGAGGDFVGDTRNGTADIRRILEGKDCLRLWWELEEAAEE